ncbi:hypothetical protein J4E85_005387 [Alternaria conjuncta]|uniref:uncharacterized protein n=1 Tax=Alternaria conjuncta TaxID=181017 RepID=UPI00221EE7D2|nr:uncharacterized protein J4E85_005387 [Alternaria conjuncta]KAI4928766.1 hypothetical protein J4E85_005387 [Alternaria conjuncta]
MTGEEFKLSTPPPSIPPPILKEIKPWRTGKQDIDISIIVKRVVKHISEEAPRDEGLKKLFHEGGWILGTDISDEEWTCDSCNGKWTGDNALCPKEGCKGVNFCNDVEDDEWDVVWKKVSEESIQYRKR